MPDPAPVLATTVAPKGFLPLSRLPAARPFAPGDLLHVSQWDADAGTWVSRAAAFDQVARAARPPCTHLVADATGTADDAGYTLDPTAGDLTLTLRPVAAMGQRELPLIHVGAAGLATVAAGPGEAMFVPDGGAGRVLAAFTLRPAETIRVRAVSVPAPSRSGWYLVGV